MTLKVGSIKKGRKYVVVTTCKTLLYITSSVDSSGLINATEFCSKNLYLKKRLFRIKDIFHSELVQLVINLLQLIHAKPIIFQLLL
jgi:hypothetical protein